MGVVSVYVGGAGGGVNRFSDGAEDYTIVICVSQMI